jgi:hypothetical protein
MKKTLTITLVVIAVAGVGLYLFRAPLFDAVAERLTADMFVAADDDAFDPGIPVGATLPAIRARYQGRTVTGLSEFVGSNGLVLFANRSVEW